jgi:hypothetical protein
LSRRGDETGQRESMRLEHAGDPDELAVTLAGGLGIPLSPDHRS